ncbi:MAG TPA: protein kinase [Candidatus Acidoferrales bacterium]|nr:protein kinase [Candidatus Acidoferrales bacterium]
MGEERIPVGLGAPTARDLTGKTVGRFSIVARLGTGGMGEVYRARDNKLRRTVALKRISPELFADKKSRERLWKEALLVSRLNDPHIAGIYDAFEEHDELFLVMEYIEGQTLRQRLHTQMYVPEFLAVATQCAAGVAAAHRAGIQHRDIKPENILLTPNGQVKILDFGISRRLPGGEDASTKESQTNAGITGSLGYMAPEVLEQQPADERADIFSLGAVFYEALAGKNPFRTASFIETCRRIVHEDPPSLSEVNPEVSPELDRIIGKMLAKRPEERYATAADLVVDLEALRRRPTKIAPTGAEQPKRLSRLMVWSLAGIAVVALATGGFFVYRHYQTPVLDEHASILIADFDNQTGNTLLDQTATEATRQALEQSHYVRLIPRAQVMETVQRMGRTGITRVDRALGREICERDNCRAVLAGTIQKNGSQYEIAEQIVDPARDEAVLTETAAMSSPTDLYSAVDSLTRKMRKHLGESLAQIEQNSQPLQQATTPSIEALQRYSRAMDLFAAGDIQGFITLANSAVALDPNFAMAHLYLARAYGALGNNTKNKEEMELALAGLGHVTERESYLIRASGYENNEEYDKAVEQYVLLTQLFPDDLEANRGLADNSIWTGHPEMAITAMQRALQLNPHSALDYDRMILYLDKVNRFAEANAAYEAARGAGVKAPFLLYAAGLTRLSLGDAEGAGRDFDELRSQGDAYNQNLASLGLARVLMYKGRLGDAIKELRAGLILDEKMKSEEWMPVRHYLLADLGLLQGREDEARSETRLLAQQAFANPESQDLRRAGLLAVELKELDTAREALKHLEGMREKNGSSYLLSCIFNLQGALKLAEGDADAAVDDQTRAAVFFPSPEVYRSLAEAYEAKHDWKNAADAHEKYLEIKGVLFQDDSPADWVEGYWRLGRVQIGQGDSKDALQSYGDFLRLWANADRGLPGLAAAKAERDRLVAAQRQNAGKSTD